MESHFFYVLRRQVMLTNHKHYKPPLKKKARNSIPEGNLMGMKYKPPLNKKWVDAIPEGNLKDLSSNRP